MDFAVDPCYGQGQSWRLQGFTVLEICRRRQMRAPSLDALRNSCLVLVVFPHWTKDIQDPGADRTSFGVVLNAAGDDVDVTGV